MCFYKRKKDFPYETVYSSSHFKCLNARLKRIFKEETVLCALTSKASASGCMIMKEEVDIPKEIFEISGSRSVSIEFRFYCICTHSCVIPHILNEHFIFLHLIWSKVKCTDSRTSNTCQTNRGLTSLFYQ